MTTALTIADVQETVAEFYGIDPALLQGLSRVAHIVKARHIAIFISMHTLPLLDIQVARHFGRHHTTGVYVRQAIRDRLDTDAAFRREFDAIVESVEEITRAAPPITKPQPS